MKAAALMPPGVTNGRQIVSAGFVGCAAAEIAISQETRYSWAAACRGRTFYCSVTGDTVCREALAPR